MNEKSNKVYTKLISNKKDREAVNKIKLAMMNKVLAVNFRLISINLYNIHPKPSKVILFKIAIGI